MYSGPFMFRINQVRYNPGKRRERPMKRSLFKLTLRAAALIACGVVMPQMSYGEAVTATVTAGNRPYAIAVNEITNKIYVANLLSTYVTVIDGSDNRTATVPVGTNPFAVAVNAETNKVYVVNRGSNTVTVINGTNNNTTTVNVGATPYAVAVNPFTNKVYVANYSNGTVTVINGDNPSNATNITVDVGYGPTAIAVNMTTNKIYVANYSGNSVTVINGIDNTTAPVNVGSSPTAIAVNEVTNKIYVANYDSNTVTEIDGIDNSTITINVGVFPFAIALDTITNKIYVANRGSDTVTVINGDNPSNATNITVNVGDFPTDIALNSVTKRVYVANQFNGNVTVIDGNDPKTETSFPIATGENPTAVAVNTSDNRVYVANQYFSNTIGNVTVMDGTPYTLVVEFTSDSGSGSVSSYPLGISCIKGSTAGCSAQFIIGTSVALTAVADARTSIFSGWSIGSCTTTLCEFIMDSGSTVKAAFTLAPLVKNHRTGMTYNDLPTAYSEVESGDTLMALSTLPAAGLNLNRAIPLTIEGGYDAAYSSYIGLTPVLGPLNVSLAPLSVKGLAIRSVPVTP
jgi:YVTN family beta-propeller protein